MTRKIYSIISIIFVGLIGYTSLFSQSPTPGIPINVYGKAILGSSTNTMNSAVIYWSVDTRSTAPTSFSVYEFIGKSDNFASFKQIATVKYIADNKDVNYNYTVNNLTESNYTFCVVANLETNGMVSSSKPSAFVGLSFLNTNPTDYLKISANPTGDVKIKLNETMTFKLVYESNRKDCKVIYSLGDYDKSIITPTISNDGSYITITGLKDSKFQVIVIGQLDCNKDIYAKAVITGIIGNGGNSTDPNQAQLSFTPAQQVIYVSPGQSSTFQVKANNLTNCDLEYSIYETNFKGVTIDAKTGVIIVPPVNIGEKYFVNIQAKTLCVNSNTTPLIAKTQITILAKQPDVPLTSQLYGKVVDQNGNPVLEGTVTCFPIDASGNATKSRVYYTNFSQGYFKSLPLAAGSYKIKFDAKGYTSAYYDMPDFAEFAAGKVVTVTDNTVTELNMALNKLPEPKKFQYIGAVTDENNNPMFAYVEFIPLELLTKGGVKGTNDKNGNYSGQITNGALVTKTDEKGMYKIDLPEMGSFVAHAVGAMNSIQYQDQYYNNVTDPFQAEILYVTADQSDVNFKLVKAVTTVDKTTKGSIYGNVIDGSNNIVKSAITAIRIDGKNTNNQFKSIATVVTDEKGNYSFTGLEVGQYVLLSMPADRAFAPGYYVDGSSVSLKWSAATAITVISDAMMPPVVQRTIIHNKVKAKGGIGIVKGNVNSKGGIVGGGKIITVQGGGIAVSGAILNLVDANGAIVDYVITAADGNFAFPSLVEGSYKLVSDKAGYDAVETAIVLDFTQSLESTTNVVLPVATTSAVEDGSSAIAQVKVYPNPAVDGITLTFNGEQGTANMNIYNEAGTMIFTNNYSVITGENNVKADLGNLQSGTYLVTILNNGRVINSKFTVVK